MKKLSIIILAIILFSGCSYQKELAVQLPEDGPKPEAAKKPLIHDGRPINDLRKTAKITDYKYFMFGEFQRIREQIDQTPSQLSRVRDITYNGLEKQVKSIFENLGYYIINESDFEEFGTEEKSKVLTCTCFFYERVVYNRPNYSMNKRWRKIIFIINLYEGDNWILKASGTDWLQWQDRSEPNDNAINLALAKIITEYANLRK
ncbi:MAG: hypothetical protein GY863_08845 [bacterium]|nr:hypothetical protein [bacterium]